MVSGECRERTKKGREGRGRKLKASPSHKVTLKASLITSAFHLPLSPKHGCVKTQRGREVGPGRRREKKREMEGEMVVKERVQ